MQKAVFIFATIFAIIFAQTCDNAQGVNSFNPQCTDKKTPYCRQITVGPPATYQCAECLSNCDCDDNEFCSNAPATIGKCLKFEKNGDDCLPYATGDLTDPTFTDEKKCAILYFDINGNQRVNQAGVCIEKTCRYCNWNPSAGGDTGLADCPVDGGIKGPRTCVYPGKLVHPRSAPWQNGLYYTNPENVWWAIFFFFFLVLLGIQGAILYFTCTK